MSPTQPERIAAIESYFKVLKWAGPIAISVSVTLGLAALGWAWRISNSMTAIKQQLADGGNAHLVAAIKQPESKQQLAASLQLVTAQVAQARAADKKPNPEKIAALSAAVSKVLATTPDIPEAWDAAFSLVSYRSETNAIASKTLPSCYVKDGSEQAIQQLRNSVARNETGTFVFGTFNCAVDLDDMTLLVGEAQKFFAVLDQVRPGTPHVIAFNAAQVTYSGSGKLPPLTLGFFNCSFNLLPPRGLPSPRARVLASDLLASQSNSLAVNLARISES